MKVQRMSDAEVREFLQEARALRNAYLAQLLRDGMKKLRSAVSDFWRGMRRKQTAALLKPAAPRRSLDIDQFVVR